MTTSEEIASEIRRLQAMKQEVEERESHERLRAIFGPAVQIPQHYSEEMFGTIARVYVLRAHKRDDLRGSFLPDSEWIRLWHEHQPDASLEELWDEAMGYYESGCGVRG